MGYFMDILLALFTISAGIFAWYSLKKFKQKPYIINFAIAALLLFIVLMTSRMQPFDWLAITALIICSVGFMAQIILGIKNFKTKAVQ